MIVLHVRDKNTVVIESGYTEYPPEVVDTPCGEDRLP